MNRLAGISKKRRVKIALLKALMLLAVAIASGIVIFLAVYVLARGLKGISWELLTTEPSYINDTIGILPDILNTLYIIIATLFFVVPLSVGAAIYLNEYAKSRRLVAVIEYAAETLSGIPSIIYGLVGMLIFCELFGFETCLLSGALTLVIMNIPTVMRTTQESLKSVPDSLREGAFGLGAGKWRVIKTVVLPCCVDGIVTGCILAVGRILGESAALLFTAGISHDLNGLFEGLFKSGATLTVALYVYTRERAGLEVGFAIAAMLMLMTLAINLLAGAVKRGFKKRRDL